MGGMNQDSPADRWPERAEFVRLVEQWRAEHVDAKGRRAPLADLAGPLGCKPSTIRQYMVVAAKRPSLDFIRRAAAEFGVPDYALDASLLRADADLSPAKGYALQRLRDLLADPLLPDAAAVALADTVTNLVILSRPKP